MVSSPRGPGRSAADWCATSPSTARRSAPQIAKARYIVSFGADFLETWGPVVEQQRGFAQAHGFDGAGMAKHVYAGPRMNLTGMNADEWHAIVPGTEALLALGMANVLLSERTGAPADANDLRNALAEHRSEEH